jgi:hypothetical protein
VWRGRFAYRRWWRQAGGQAAFGIRHSAWRSGSVVATHAISRSERRSVLIMVSLHLENPVVSTEISRNREAGSLLLLPVPVPTRLRRVGHQPGARFIRGNPSSCRAVARRAKAEAGLLLEKPAAQIRGDCLGRLVGGASLHPNCYRDRFQLSVGRRSRFLPARGIFAHQSQGGRGRASRGQAPFRFDPDSDFDLCPNH